MSYGFEAALDRLGFKLKEMEARLDRAERLATDARDECFRLEARLSTLEYER